MYTRIYKRLKRAHRWVNISATIIVSKKYRFNIWKILYSDAPRKAFRQTFSRILIYWIIYSLRYWAVTQVDYIHSRTSGRVKAMIGLVWILSIVVSLAPQFGWKDPEYMERIEQQKCMVSQDVAYQVNMLDCFKYDFFLNKYFHKLCRCLRRAVHFMFLC